MSEAFRRIQPTIPQPEENLHAIFNTVLATKQAVEDINGQAGTVGTSAVTWDDLVRLGLITRERVPKKFG